MWEIVAAVAGSVVVLGAGGALTDLSPWYYGLRQPSFKPPDWLFAPAWTLIIGLGATACVLAWRQAATPGDHALVIGLAVLNGTLNICWSLLFFRMRRPDLALIETTFLWLSILAPMLALAHLSPWAPWLLAPYLAWVSFASVLNAAYVKLNAPFGARAEAARVARQQ